MRMFDSTKIPLLNKALDAYALRQKVTAANMANITTAGYKSQSVAFEEHLASAQSHISVRSTNDKHFAVGGSGNVKSVVPQVHDTAADEPAGYNELASGFNDVDIDFEMTELAKNQIRFKFGSRLLGDSFKGIQKAIRGTL